MFVTPVGNLGGPKELKVLLDKLKGGPGALASRGGTKILGGPMNPNDAMMHVSDDEQGINKLA